MPSTATFRSKDRQKVSDTLLSVICFLSSPRSSTSSPFFLFFLFLFFLFVFFSSSHFFFSFSFFSFSYGFSFSFFLFLLLHLFFIFFFLHLHLLFFFFFYILPLPLLLYYYFFFFFFILLFPLPFLDQPSPVGLLRLREEQVLPLTVLTSLKVNRRPLLTTTDHDSLFGHWTSALEY